MSALTLDHYSHDRGDDFHTCGADVLLHETEDLAGSTLLIEANLAFGRRGDGLLEVTEVVGMWAGRPYRIRYRYHFSYDSLFVWRYDRDPKNHSDMPMHKHVGTEDNRIVWDRVTFSQVVSEVYEYVFEVEG